MKTCTRCGLAQEATEYAKNGSNGWHTRCKTCAKYIEKQRRLSNPEATRAADRQRYAENKDAKKLAISTYYQANSEAIKANAAERYQEDPTRFRAMAAAYRARNQERVYEWNGTRRALLRSALPAWADRAEIRAIYAKAKSLTRSTGIVHHVDHVVPLTSEFVCGLHVPANLRVVTASENLAKSNKWQS